jgi:hypothetical protein
MSRWIWENYCIFVAGYIGLATLTVVVGLGRLWWLCRRQP